MSNLRSISRRRALGLAVGVIAWARHVGAAQRLEIRAIIGAASPAMRQIVEALRARYVGIAIATDVQTLAHRRGTAVYLAIGPAALQAALDANLSAPIVGLFVSSQTFRKLITSANARQRASVTAIYAEASPEAQLQLVKAMYEHRVSVGVLLTETTADQENLLKRVVRKLDLDLQVRRASAGSNVLRELAHLSGTTVLLAIPDSSLYTAESLPGILESTYRRGQPVVGFSPALVAAGTLAAAYASLDDVLAHLDQVLAEIDAGRLPDPQYPVYWRVTVNDSVARSLNIVLSSEVRGLGSFPSARPR